MSSTETAPHILKSLAHRILLTPGKLDAINDYHAVAGFHPRDRNLHIVSVLRPFSSKVPVSLLELRYNPQLPPELIPRGESLELFLRRGDRLRGYREFKVARIDGPVNPVTAIRLLDSVHAVVAEQGHFQQVFLRAQIRGESLIPAGRLQHSIAGAIDYLRGTSELLPVPVPGEWSHFSMRPSALLVSADSAAQGWPLVREFYPESKVNFRIGDNFLIQTRLQLAWARGLLRLNDREAGKTLVLLVPDANLRGQLMDYCAHAAIPCRTINKR